jgi:predicted RNase H-like HicB family nuclease
MKSDTYSVIIIWSDEDEAFIVTVPELPGCRAHGETKSEALAEAQIAIENWMDTARELGREIPAPKHFVDYEKELDQSLAKSAEELQSDMSQAIIKAAPVITPAIVEALAKHLAESGEDVWLSYAPGAGIRIVRATKLEKARESQSTR